LFLAGERQAPGTEGTAELVERLWPDTMKLLDLGLTQLGYLRESQIASIDKRSSCRLGQIEGQVARLLIVLLTLHTFLLDNSSISMPWESSLLLFG
jgi:hypothetical protein